RDGHVTGVQTCALPISVWSAYFRRKSPNTVVIFGLKPLIVAREALIVGAVRQEVLTGIKDRGQFETLADALRYFPDEPVITADQIGRASCRERRWSTVR